MTDEPVNSPSGMVTTSGGTTAKPSAEQPLDSRTLTQDKSEVVLESKIPDELQNIPIVQAERFESRREVPKDFGFLPIPKRLQYDPERPFVFTMVLNVAFGFGSTFTVMNLYYCQPLLIQFANSFHVSDNEVSRIPTVVQAGYAAGLLLISPLGDLVKRRPLLLLLVFLSASLTIGLAVTTSIKVFEALCFLVGVVTVTPQVLIPFAADLAPPHRRASAIATVLAGLLLGILIARVVAGTIAQFITWRIVYYLAIGLQFFILFVLYLLLPDWPAKNSEQKLTYWGVLRSMGKYALTEPVLVQACLISFASSACFTNFWVTLTFLLGGPPYHYSTLAIGLFGLVGILGVCTAPFIGRLIDRLVPWFATLVATCILLVFQSVLTSAAGINIAAVVLACFGIDVGRQTQQVSLTTAVYGVEPSARARLNAVLIISIFCGQVMGTAVGSTIFLKFGWRAGAGFSLGLTGFQLLVLLARGPHCDRYTWFGWQGGIEMRKKVVSSKTEQPHEKEKPTETNAGKENIDRCSTEKVSGEDGSEGIRYESDEKKEAEKRVERVV